MNIQPLKNDAVALPAKSKAPAAPKAPQTSAAPDDARAERKRQLLDTLRAEPDVRPEVVERARALAADPSWPSADMLAKLAKKFVDGSK